MRTPAEWSEPITRVYEQVTDGIIINLARHMNINADKGGEANLPSLQWQAKKLAQLGAVERETIAIIANGTGKTPEAVWNALLGAAGEALEDGELALLEAARSGAIAKPGTETISPAVKQALDAFSRQAVEQLNLVNTVMLDSAKKSYVTLVNNTVMYEQTSMSAVEETVAQRVLNAQTGSVILGASSRTEALRKAVKQMSDNGITGFVDRGGHNWSAEAYVNMDIRTTVARAARQAQQTRTAEFGVDTFQITSKAAARPLCAPYQGWICSWSGRTGTVTDLYGNTYALHSIHDTTYGEPAGIFGINCGHKAATFIDGYSIPRYEPLGEDGREANAAAYELSQQQRALERKVRYAKRDAAVADAMGDRELFDDASKRVRAARAEYDDFIARTGRTERLDRTQVYAYNRSVSGKAVASAKAQAEAKKLQEFIADVKKQSGVRGEINIPPIPINIQALSFDDRHINLERKHNVTEDEAKAFIINARLTVTRWKGKFINYFSDDGASCVEAETNIIRTAFKSIEYDSKIKSIIEMIKIYVEQNK